MKKFYSTLLLTCLSLTAFAQEQNDTTYVMFDFNLNPWNYPVSTAEKGWGPDFDDLTGAILEARDFTWPITEGSDKLITITVDVDLDETVNNRVPILCRRTNVNAGITTYDGQDSIMTMLFTYQGTTMRFKAPEGYQFGKMVFYNYRSSNFLVGDEYDENKVDADGNVVYGSDGKPEKVKFWTPASPKKNSYDYNIWEGDAKNILFNYPYFSAHFMKIDIRLVKADATGIETVTRPVAAQHVTTLDGRAVKADNMDKGLYIIDGKKYVVK